MTDATGGSLITLRCWCPHAVFADRMPDMLETLEALGGVVLVARPVHQVRAVEPGSVPAHLLLAWLPAPDGAETFWQRLEESGTAALLSRPRPALVLAVSGLPADGLGPDIPTLANVGKKTEADGPGFLVIEGTADDQDRMDRYRDILLPMMVARDAYYVAFELGGSVRVLSGDWNEAIFAVSRWPSPARALDCWKADRYQRDAIPLRLDIGHFSVLLTHGGDTAGGD